MYMKICKPVLLAIVLSLCIGVFIFVQDRDTTATPDRMVYFEDDVVGISFIYPEFWDAPIVEKIDKAQITGDRISFPSVPGNFEIVFTSPYADGRGGPCFAGSESVIITPNGIQERVNIGLYNLGDTFACYGGEETATDYRRSLLYTSELKNGVIFELRADIISDEPVETYLNQVVEVINSINISR